MLLLAAFAREELYTEKQTSLRRQNLVGPRWGAALRLTLRYRSPNVWFLIPASMDIEYCQHFLQVLDNILEVLFSLSPANIEILAVSGPKPMKPHGNVHKIDFSGFFLSPGRKKQRSAL